MELNINYDQTIPASTMNMIGAGAILVLSVLIVMIIIIFRRWRGRVLPLFIGLLTYSIFVFIFANLGTSLITLIPGVEDAFNYNKDAYLVVYNILIIVGFAITRWIDCKLITGRYEREGDVYLLGIGISVGDTVVMYGLSMFAYYIYAGTIANSGLRSVIDTMVSSGLSADEIMSEYNNYLVQLINAPSFLWMLLGISAIMDVVLNVCLTIVTFGVIKEKANYMWIYYGALIQFASTILFQIYNVFSTTSILIFFAAKAAIVVGIVFILWRYVFKGIEYSND